ncbi:transglutaminase-like cysteine peptidase [Desulfopila sp. IMCC35008]|uniref:transglutaminase-like cysteine peptidase n=1 Tax=Desulfopila sp. IMCC35008 TaxID=2653858 RepID=UPI0013D4D4BE|nr:transglutaminase-like cysteine peptidase [Desulfopila sp. IMCC35008]
MRLLPFLFLSLLFSFFITATLYAEYRPWSEKVFIHAEKEYGQQAAKRLRYLHNLALENQELPVMEKLELVNRTLNNLPWIADSQHWKQADYWASPIETLATFGGDCEDIAIAKWITLNHFGISGKYLRLAYVKIKRTGESHMVLVYIEDPDEAVEKQKGGVLDNYVDEIKRGADRKDLLAVYITDAKGNLTLIKDTGSDRSIQAVFKERKMKNLEDLKKKIAEDRKKSQEINDGIPLLPAGW